MYLDCVHPSLPFLVHLLLLVTSFFAQLAPFYYFVPSNYCLLFCVSVCEHMCVCECAMAHL